MRMLCLLLMAVVPSASQDLWGFLQAGQYDQAREFLRINGEVDAKREGSSPLHWAAKKQNLGAARFLVEHGADLEALDLDENTPLVIASETGDLEMVRFLVAKGARMDAFSRWGRNALSSAIRSKKDSVIDFLLDRMGDPFVEPSSSLPCCHDPTNALFHAVGMCDTATFRKIFALRPDPHAKTKRGKTLLMAAAEANSPALVRQLLSLGADPFSFDPNGNTALHLACKQGADSVLLEVLLASGVDAHRKNRYGEAPLHLAAQSKNLANVRVLLTTGVDIEASNRQGKRPFEIAMDEGLVDVAILLAEKGARPIVEARQDEVEGIRVADWHPAFAKLALQTGWDPDGPVYTGRYAFNGSRETFLTLAARQGWKEVVELALSKGADPYLENSRGSNAFQVALENAQYESFHLLAPKPSQVEARQATEALRKLVARDDTKGGISILMRSGAHIDGRDDSGGTPLMIAAQNREALNVKVLLKWKADPSLRDHQGRSALHHALGSRCFPCVQSLVEHGASPGDAFPLKWSLVSYALQHHDTASARYLLKTGASPTLVAEAYPSVFGADDGGALALFALGHCPGLDLDHALLEAAKTANVAVVKRLLTRGADVNARASDGSTPLIHACVQGSREVVELLEKHGAHRRLKNRKGESGDFVCDLMNGD